MTILLIILAALATWPATAMAQPNLPVDGGVVTSGVGWRVDPFGSGKLAYHRGTDIAVPEGTPVRATRPGLIVFSGIHGGHGKTVIIEHADGDRTLYGHNSSLYVKPGERIETGRLVAFSGNTGRSTGPHVHYEVLSKGGHIPVQMAKSEKAIPPRSALERGKQEQKMDEIVNSLISRLVADSSQSSDSTGQGG